MKFTTLSLRPIRLYQFKLFMMGKKKEEVLEEEIREIGRSFSKLLEVFLPPKEVREEVMRNIYTIELSLLRIFKTLIDYQVEKLEEKAEPKKKAKKIEVE